MQELVNAVVIDDDTDDLLGISTALAKQGISTIPIHYQGSSKAKEAYAACEKAAQALPRIIITDIQMNDGGSTPTKTDLGNVTGCLEKIVSKTAGPYIILAWTSIPDHFSSLKEYVEEYFQKKTIRLPLYFDRICKSECKKRGEYNADAILEKFSNHLEKQLQLKALMHWERTIFNSAIGSVNDLFKTCNASSQSIASILKALADGVAGRNLPDFESVAINEALSYLLKDKVGQSNFNTESKDIWKKAITNEKAGLNDVAKHHLNSLLHFDGKPSQDIICPGDLWKISREDDFFKLITNNDHKNQIDRLKEEFIIFDENGYKLQQRISKARKDDYKRKLKSQLKSTYTDIKQQAKKNISIVAIEISPICDFSNKKKALKSLALGIMIPAEKLTKQVCLKKSDSIIICPMLYDGKENFIALSAKYILSMSESKILDRSLDNQKILRVRESILQSWIHKLSSYNSRIGTVSFQ